MEIYHNLLAVLFILVRVVSKIDSRKKVAKVIMQQPNLLMLNT